MDGVGEEEAVMRWCCWYCEVVGLARIPDWEEDRERRGAARVAEEGCGGAADEAGATEVGVLGEAGEVGEVDDDELGRNRRVGERAMWRIRAPRPWPFAAGTGSVEGTGWWNGGGGCVGKGGWPFDAAGYWADPFGPS